MTLGLSDTQLQSFWEQGFVVVEDLFSAHEVEVMRKAFHGLQEVAESFEIQDKEAFEYRGSYLVLEPYTQNGQSGIKIHRIAWCGALEPTLLDYGADPRLLVPAAQILGMGSMEQLINQAHFKMPNDGVAFGWHQDSSNRRYGTPLWKDINGTGSYVQTAIAVDPMTEENGPMFFVPGSHKHGHLELHGKSEEELLEIFDPDDAVPTIMKAGSVAFFGPFTIHCSFPNRSKEARRLFVNGYACPGANFREYPGEGVGRLLHAEGWKPTTRKAANS